MVTNSELAQTFLFGAMTKGRLTALLDEAEQRGRDAALEDVTLALDKATPLTNGVDAPSRIEWMFARIEDTEAERDHERTQAINDCIAALERCNVIPDGDNSLLILRNLLLEPKEPGTHFDEDGTLRNADGSRSIFDDVDE